MILDSKDKSKGYPNGTAMATPAFRINEGRLLSGDRVFIC